MNLPDAYGRFKTFEASVTRRYGNRWSGQIGFGYTWTTDFPEGFPQNPNQAGVYDRTGWGLKATGTYDVALGHPALAGPAAPVGRATSRARSACQATRRRRSVSCCQQRLLRRRRERPREDNIWVFDVRAEKTLNLIEPHATPRVHRLLQHHQQPCIGGDYPDDGRQLPAPGEHPGAVHGAARVPVPLVGD